MCIGSICNNDPILLGRVLGWVVVVLELCDLLFLHFLILDALANGHLHPTVFDNIIGPEVTFVYFLGLLQNFIF